MSSPESCPTSRAVPTESVSPSEMPDLHGPMCFGLGRRPSASRKLSRDGAIAVSCGPCRALQSATGRELTVDHRTTGPSCWLLSTRSAVSSRERTVAPALGEQRFVALPCYGRRSRRTACRSRRILVAARSRSVEHVAQVVHSTQLGRQAHLPVPWHG